jgi:hypothetical protein
MNGAVPLIPVFMAWAGNSLFLYYHERCLLGRGGVQLARNGNVFEVRHPRCVSQITKLHNRRLKSKHNCIIICIYIADGGNN